MIDWIKDAATVIAFGVGAFLFDVISGALWCGLAVIRRVKKWMRSCV